MLGLEMHLQISCGSCSQGAHSIGKQESNKYLQFIMSNALGKVTQSTMGKYGRPPTQFWAGVRVGMVEQRLSGENNACAER